MTRNHLRRTVGFFAPPVKTPERTGGAGLGEGEAGAMTISAVGAAAGADGAPMGGNCSAAAPAGHFAGPSGDLGCAFEGGATPAISDFGGAPAVVFIGAACGAASR